MDSIASYVSSDSENDSHDGEKQDNLGTISEEHVSRQEIQSSYKEQSFQNQIFLSRKRQAVPYSNNRESAVSSLSQQHESYDASSNIDSILKNNTVKFKGHMTEESTVTTVSRKDSVKPYIPKSKRTKLINESKNNDKTQSGSISLPSKRSGIFQKAEAFSQNTSLQYRVPKGHVQVDFEAHKGCVNRIAWNPCFTDFLLSASMDSVVKVWNVQTTPCCVHRVQNHTQAVKDAKWSHCGLQVLSGGYDKMARITDINLGQEICVLSHNSFVTSVQYHPTDPNVFLSGTSNDGIFAWDVRTQKFICMYKSFFGQIQDLAFLPDGKSFISAAEVLKRNSTDKGIMVWDYSTSTILSNQVFQEAYTCTALQIHPTDNTFLAQCNAGYIAVFSQRSPYKLNKFKRFEGHHVSGYHIGLNISPDGTLVASGSADGTIFIYNYRTSNVLKSFPLHSQPCMDVAWSPTIPSLLASCDWNGRIFLHR